MRKKLISLIILLLLLLPAAALFNSCGNRTCPPSYCHFAKSISVIAVDNADSLPHDILNGETYAKALLLQMTLRDSLTQDTMGRCYHQSPNPFLSGAMATSCIKCERDVYADEPVLFTITSDHDFDQAHPAGTDLRPLFYCRDVSFLNAGIYSFYLNTAPVTDQVHTFTFTIKYSSGKVLTAIVTPVKLLV